MVDLDKLNTRSGPFVDPAAIEDAQRAAVLAGVLPSSNLAHVDDLPPKQAFREEVQRLFASSQIEGRSLLSVLLEVEANRAQPLVPAGSVSVTKCPDCDAKLDRPPHGPLAIDEEGANCPVCDATLYTTDTLRAHEAFRENGSNLEAAGRVMSVAERLILLALVSHLRARQRSTLGQMAFITDGPLALFGEVASIRHPLLRLLQQMAAAQLADGLGLPVMLGIEKSGHFQEHAEAIRDHISPGQLMLLDDEYLERYITFRGASAHGRDTYYGRHFFYRGAAGQMFTITVPPLGRIGAFAHEPFQLTDYPTLRATCATLDRIATRLYQNATIPVTLAHHYAAYPLAQAGRVLKLHAEEYLDRSQPAEAAA
jgi:hypothetical protein